MNFKIEEIEEYEKIIGLPYEKWTQKIKLDFFQWIQYKNKLEELDNYVKGTRDPDYFYNKELKEYLDMGFQILYSKGDKKNPIRDDIKDIIQNEKIIYHQDYGIIGNITKRENQEGKIRLEPFDFYYEIEVLDLGDTPASRFEFRQKYNIRAEEIRAIIENYKLISPWNKTNEDLLLTRQLHGTPEKTKEIIATFAEEIINSLGYIKKKDGKIYSKKCLF